jgi:outer membrane protein assembly factor BamD (BamD/ComL family)
VKSVLIIAACLWLSGCSTIGDYFKASGELKNASDFAQGKKYSKAANAYNKIMTDYPDSPQAADALFELSLLQAQHSESERDIARALHGFEAFIRRYPSDWRAHEAGDLVLILKSAVELKRENEHLKRDIDQLRRLDIRHEERRIR